MTRRTKSSKETYTLATDCDFEDGFASFDDAMNYALEMECEGVVTISKVEFKGKGHKPYAID